MKSTISLAAILASATVTSENQSVPQLTDRQLRDLGVSVIESFEDLKAAAVCKDDIGSTVGSTGGKTVSQMQHTSSNNSNPS